MKIIKLIILVVAINTVNIASADIFSFFKKSSSSESTTTTANTIGSIINSIVSTDKVEVKDVVGEWKYSSPSISFKSDNILEQAGGNAAVTTIENKLAPYFKKVGFESFVINIKSDSTFEITIRNKTITGTIANGTEKGTLLFNFSAFGKVGSKSYTFYVTKGVSEMSLMLDVTKFSEFLANISSYAGSSSSIAQVASLLKRYKGVYAGMSLTKK